MRKWLLIFTLLCLTWIPSGVQAQGKLKLSEVQVELWPEFDQPAVLVIAHLQMAPDTSLPASLVLRIPAQATLNAVATQDANGGLLNAAYDKKEEGDWLVLTIEAVSSEVQVEYYDTLVKDGSSRHYVYTWPGDYAVDAFSIVFQQPVGASGLELNPTPSENWVGSYDLTYYRSKVVALADGETFSFEANYIKSTDTLSGEGLQVRPSGSLEPKSMSDLWIWVLGGLGVVFLAVAVGVGISWKRTGRKGDGQPRRRHAPRKQDGESSPSAIYCHQCGNRAQAGDAFCRSCGTRLRQSE